MSQKTKTNYIDQIWVKIGFSVELVSTSDKVDSAVLSDITVSEYNHQAEPQKEMSETDSSS